MERPFLTPFKRPFRITKGNNIIELAPSPYFFIKSICLEAMSMFAKFDEIAAITFQDIKEQNIRQNENSTDVYNQRRGVITQIE